MMAKRPVLPPRYINTSMAVLLVCKNERALFYTYTCLRALAWSEDYLQVHPKIVEKEFGIPKATLYRHLNRLASSSIHAVLRYGSAGGGDIQIEFAPYADVQSQFSEMRIAYSASGSPSSQNKCIDSGNGKPAVVNTKVSSLNIEKASLENETDSPNIEKASLEIETDSPNIEKASLEIEKGRPNIFSLYEENIGPLVPLMADTLRDAEEEYSEEWIRDAFAIAVENQARSWRYVVTILERWKAKGKDRGRGKGSREAGERGGRGESVVTRMLKELEVSDGE
uniref:Putative DnaB domain protein n=2 Tax=viral metagenome TaxID=1070528 RepID=A0A6M3KU05_9ZZZZ